jgi:lysophospholipase L1-like esterase
VHLQTKATAIAVAFLFYICCMSLNATLKLSLLLNLVLGIALAGIFLMQYQRKQEEQKRVAEEAAKRHLFSDNPQYTEQTGFYTLFRSQANIVMLGDSHYYRIHWNELLGRSDVANRGIGSDITEGYLNRMNSVLSAGPKICFIEGGGNDIFWKVPVDTILQHIRQITHILKAHQVTPVLTALFFAGHDFIHNDSSKYNNQVALLNEGLHRMALTDTLPIIDINSLLIDKDRYLRKEFVRGDGIHLTSAAYAIWRDSVNAVLRQEGF